jgi:hypothetical protein
MTDAATSPTAAVTAGPGSKPVARIVTAARAVMIRRVASP